MKRKAVDLKRQCHKIFEGGFLTKQIFMVLFEVTYDNFEFRQILAEIFEY